jgi:hypothetical protein
MAILTLLSGAELVVSRDGMGSNAQRLAEDSALSYGRNTP